MLGECGEHEQVVGIQPGGAEDRQPFRKIAVSRARAAAWLARLAHVRPGSAHQAHHAAAARVRPARHGRRAAAIPRRRRRGLGTNCRSWSVGWRRTWRRGRPDAARSTSAVRRGADPARPTARWRQGSARARLPTVRPRQPSITRSSGHTARCGCHGSASSSSALPARARATSRRGEGKSTPTQTPSLRPGAAPEPLRQALGQPAFHARGGHADDLRGERIRQRNTKQIPECSDQPVGPLCAMEVERHGRGQH